MSNVLTAGQIPTSCEIAYFRVGWGSSRSIDGVCGNKPVTHILIGYPEYTENSKRPTRKYICTACSLNPINQWVKSTITPLTDYEVEEAGYG